MRMIAGIAAAAAVLMLCAPGPASAHPRHRIHRHDFISRRTPEYIHCDGKAGAAEYSGVRPDFTVQYGCIEHPEMMSGSLGAMLQGKNPAAGALP
jgi:hypothetical protein